MTPGLMWRKSFALGASVALAAVAVVAAVTGCAVVAGCAAAGDDCRVGSDCASGACSADGRCVPVSHDDAATPVDAAAAPPDSGADRDAGMPPSGDGGPSLCSPTNDGTITRDELPLGAGLHATFEVATGATFDTAGTTLSDGTRRWDMTVALAGDHSVRSETLSLDGTWFAADFPGATYHSRLTDDQDLDGVFEVTGSALLLRGVVSPAGGATRTELTYDPPVPVLQLPLRAGASWRVTSSITGTALGVPVFYSEVYDSSVDATGTLATPFSEFSVLRVRTVMTRSPAPLPLVSRTFLFTTECFGIVGTVRSQDNELGTEFTRTAEVRRLTP